MDDDHISLREVLAMLGRRFIWVLLPLVLFTGLSVAAVYYMMPVYEASTTLIITNPTGSPTSYETLLFNRNLAKTYSEVARSRSVAAEAAAMLGLQESLDQFQARVRVSVVRDTEVINISVTDTDPVRAAEAANALAEAFRSRFWQFTFLDSLRIIDPAEPPAEPIRPQPVLYAAVGVVVGLAAGIGLAALVDHLFPRRPRPAVPAPVAAEQDGQATLPPVPQRPAPVAAAPSPDMQAAGSPTAGALVPRAPMECVPAANPPDAGTPANVAADEGAAASPPPVRQERRRRFRIRFRTEASPRTAVPPEGTGEVHA